MYKNCKYSIQGKFLCKKNIEKFDKNCSKYHNEDDCTENNCSCKGYCISIDSEDDENLLIPMSKEDTMLKKLFTNLAVFFFLNFTNQVAFFVHFKPTTIHKAFRY